MKLLGGVPSGKRGGPRVNRTLWGDVKKTQDLRVGGGSRERRRQYQRGFPSRECEQ